MATNEKWIPEDELRSVVVEPQFLQLDTSLINKVNATSFVEAAKRPLLTGFNISKAESILQYKPVSFREGLSTVFNQVH